MLSAHSAIQVRISDKMHRRSFDLARTVVNLAAFCEGYGWTVLFEHFVDDSGVQTPFIARDLDLAALCTTYSGSVDFGKILTIVGTDPTLMRHLNDLIQAITIPHESSASCARAIEGLKHMVARPDSSDSAAWRQMQEALRADKAYLQFITMHRAKVGTANTVGSRVTSQERLLCEPGKSWIDISSTGSEAERRRSPKMNFRCSLVDRRNHFLPITSRIYVVAFVQPLLCCFHFASLYGGTGSSNPVRSTPEEVLRRRWRHVD